MTIMQKDNDEVEIDRSLILLQQGLHNDKYDGNGDDGEVIKSDHRNGGEVEGSDHQSRYFNSDGYIQDQGGRTMVGWSHAVVMILMVMSMIMDDYQNCDAGDREK